jgi:hypothetical protein
MKFAKRATGQPDGVVGLVLAGAINNCGRMDVERGFGWGTDGAVFNEETGLVELAVSLQPMDQIRIGFHNQMPRAIFEEAVGHAGNDAEAGAELDDSILRFEELFDEAAFLGLVTIPPKASAAPADIAHLFGGNKSATIGLVNATREVEKEAAKRVKHEEIEPRKPSTRRRRAEEKVQSLAEGVLGHRVWLAEPRSSVCRGA